MAAPAAHMWINRQPDLQAALESNSITALQPCSPPSPQHLTRKCLRGHRTVPRKHHCCHAAGLPLSVLVYRSHLASLQLGKLVPQHLVHDSNTQPYPLPTSDATNSCASYIQASQQDNVYTEEPPHLSCVQLHKLVPQHLVHGCNTARVRPEAVMDTSKGDACSSKGCNKRGEGEGKCVRSCRVYISRV